MTATDDRAARREAVVRRHLDRLSAHDRDAWLECFSSDPELVEPADAPPQRGRHVFEALLDGVVASGNVVTLEPAALIVNGDRVAAHIAVRSTRPDGITYVGSVIEIYTFDDDDRICSATAFVDPTAMSEVSER